MNKQQPHIFKPHPCRGPWRPPSAPERLQKSPRRHSPPVMVLQARPRREGWCSSRSRPESLCLWGCAERTSPPLQRGLRSTRRRSWRRARRNLRGSSGRSPASRRPSCSGCRTFDFVVGSGAFWPCSSWSPSSPRQSQSAPCWVSGSRPSPSCIWRHQTNRRNSVFNRHGTEGKLWKNERENGRFKDFQLNWKNHV